MTNLKPPDGVMGQIQPSLQLTMRKYRAPDRPREATKLKIEERRSEWTRDRGELSLPTAGALPENGQRINNSTCKKALALALPSLTLTVRMIKRWSTARSHGSCSETPRDLELIERI